MHFKCWVFFVINNISAIIYCGFKAMGVYSNKNEVSTQLLDKMAGEID